MKRPFLSAVIVVVLVAVGAVVWTAMHPGPLPTQPATARTAAKATAPTDANTKMIERGEYLARMGDCVACHTEPTSHAFAGGRAMATPFGNLYTSNITPDDETGIGRWTADDFYRMMHTGISRDGTLLYPAMPFACGSQR